MFIYECPRSAKRGALAFRLRLGDWNEDNKLLREQCVSKLLETEQEREWRVQQAMQLTWGDALPDSRV